MLLCQSPWQNPWLRLLPKTLHLPARYYSAKLRQKLEPEINYLKALVGARKRAIDVGANRGYYTFPLSKLCQVVEVFEPQLWALDLIRAYGAPNINCHQVGLSNREGYLDLHIPIRQDGRLEDCLASFQMPTSPKIPVKSVQVPVKCLDDYQFRDVSFIKIDVEGYEYKVISGARETIKTSKPILLVEIEQRHLQFQSMQEVFEGILRLGYQGSFFYKNQRLDITQFSYNDHQAPFIDQLVRDGYAPGYVNNFIFEPLQPS